MSQLRFRLPPSFRGETGLRRAYVTGQDRTPSRVEVELRGDLLVVRREAPESARLHVPWPVEGFGTPFVATATLAERREPYDLGVELARGKLNEVRNQLADWRQMGLAVPAALDRHLDGARRRFARAATSQDRPEAAAEASAATLAHTFAAGQVLVESYAVQVLKRRLELSGKLPTQLACALQGQPKAQAWAAPLAGCLTAGRLRCHWAAVAPDEGKPRFDDTDAQYHWCRRKGLAIAAGPLIDLRPGALPDWLWLWQGDADQILDDALKFVRQVVGRYRGKVATWHLVARPASGEVLGLSEEQQVRLTARVVQLARSIDPDAHHVVDLDRPWAEWLAAGKFRLGPLHLADSLARADVGLGGIGLEVAPGYSEPGSHLRDLLEFSRLLDLFALINLPLHLSFAFPASSGPGGDAAGAPRVEAGQWPRPPDEALQKEWASQWIGLAAAKPFVRSLTWLEPVDGPKALYPGAGLFRPDGSPRPLLSWLGGLRRDVLS